MSFETFEAWRVAENAAPVDTDGPLPYETQTLKYIPEANRQQYVRTMTGGFKLGWVESGSPDVPRFAELIAEGKLAVMPVGMTPADLAAREAEKAQMQADTQAEIRRLEQKEIDEYAARMRGKAEKEAERVRLETERLIREYGTPAPSHVPAA